MCKVIGIADTCRAGEAVVGINYPNAVLRAGHVPVILPCTDRQETVRQMVERIDALLLPGGGSDVDPALYGAERSPYLAEVVAERDAFEFLLIREAVRRRIPVLGICRGVQTLNVYFGGTLYQDLPTEMPVPPLQHQRPDLQWDVVHPIQITPDSRLAAIVGSLSTGVNSTHHQACREVAPGFHVVATSDDGIIEAIESDTLPILGVQFHPERLINLPDTPFLRLFASLPEWR